MKQEKWSLYPAVSVPLFLYLLLPAFSEGFRVGIGYTFAGSSAIYYGFIFRHWMAMILVYVGVAFAGVLSSLATDIFNSVLIGEWFPAMAVFGVGVWIWVWAERMKRVDFEWKPAFIRYFQPTSRAR